MPRLRFGFFERMVNVGSHWSSFRSSTISKSARTSLTSAKVSIDQNEWNWFIETAA